MTPIPPSQMVEWILEEEKSKGAIVRIGRPYRTGKKHNRTIFERTLETPVGPAARPHTQLTQSIMIAYYAGSRFSELRTVQIINGEDLLVSKPCIKADGECYDYEWSTELYVPQAQEKYIKAQFLPHMLAEEHGLGDADGAGFRLNMSVGYDLEGIKPPETDSFTEPMKDTSETETYQAYRQYLLERVGKFKYMTKENVENISSNICNSVTLSTLHGYPPQEIEQIAIYLTEEEGLHTSIKCNPTLLGYGSAWEVMDRTGYDYVAFGDLHSLGDLQYENAVSMLKRPMTLADGKNLESGVRIINTFPVNVKQNELPNEETYMSDKSLYPLSIPLAVKLVKKFDGKLRISCSGSADFFNIKEVADTGIQPATVATVLLKPGGYQRMSQTAEPMQEENGAFEGVSVERTTKLAENATTDRHHVRDIRPSPSGKIGGNMPLMDCFFAPRKEGRPIHQDIITCLQLAGAGRYEEAMKVVTEKNPLPFITGTICAHSCMSKCDRNLHEDPVSIHGVRLVYAEDGYDTLMKEMKAEALSGKKIAIMSGGPTDTAAAYFLTRNGLPATIYEQKDSLDDVVKHVIPGFRIADGAIEKDAPIVAVHGAEVKYHTTVSSLDELRVEGRDCTILATGTSKPSVLELEVGETVSALDFLAESKTEEGRPDIGSNAVVTGGRNTAMDMARAAERTTGAECVYLVYRRMKRYMPTDAEELEMAAKDGVESKGLLAPVKLENGRLLCDVMELSSMDISGRHKVAKTGETVETPTDTVITAVGEQVSTSSCQESGINVSECGKASVNEETLEASREDAFVIDSRLGGLTIVMGAMGDAGKAAEAILGKPAAMDLDNMTNDLSELYNRRGTLVETKENREGCTRCLGCFNICENRVDVCPNRANVTIIMPGMEKRQVIHVDYICNEYDNCKSFCPYNSTSYLDKFTLFVNEADMENSKDRGFVVLNTENGKCRVRYLGDIYTCKTSDENSRVPEGLRRIIAAVCQDYNYLSGQESR